MGAHSLPPTVSVVVPVLGGHATLEALAVRAHAALAPLTGDLELIAVSDAAGPAARDAIRALCARHPWARGIELQTRVGQHLALLAGMQAARMQWIATLDDDFQHPPEQLPLLLDAITPEVDLIYGTCANPDQGWPRRVAAALAREVLAWKVGKRAMRGASAMRLMRSDVRASLGGIRPQAPVLDVALGCGAREVRGVLVRFAPRASGRSGYGWVGAMRLLVAIVRAPRSCRPEHCPEPPYVVLAEHGGSSEATGMGARDLAWKGSVGGPKSS